MSHASGKEQMRKAPRGGCAVGLHARRPAGRLPPERRAALRRGQRGTLPIRPGGFGMRVWAQVRGPDLGCVDADRSETWLIIQHFRDLEDLHMFALLQRQFFSIKQLQGQASPQRNICRTKYRNCLIVL